MKNLPLSSGYSANAFEQELVHLRHAIAPQVQKQIFGHTNYPDISADDELRVILMVRWIMAERVTIREEVKLPPHRLRDLVLTLFDAMNEGGLAWFRRRYEEFARDFNYAFLQGWQPLLTCPIKADAHRETLFAPQTPSRSQSPTPPPQEERLREGPLGTLICEVAPQQVNWLWQDYIALGTLTLLDGDPGRGKSLILLDLAARITQGLPMPDGSSGSDGGVVIIAPEDNLGSAVRPRLERAGADLSRVVSLPTVPVRDTRTGEIGERPFSLWSDIDLLEELIDRVGAKLVIIDPLMAVVDARDTSRDSVVRKRLHALLHLLERKQVACVVIRHLTKAGPNKLLYRGGGSIAFIAQARSGLFVIADPQDEARSLLVQSQDNLSALAPSLIYRVCSDSDLGDARGYVEWMGTTPIIPQLYSGSVTPAYGRLRQRILALFGPGKHEDLTTAEIAEAIPDVPYVTVRLTLRRMVDDGQILKLSKGLYVLPGSHLCKQVDEA